MCKRQLPARAILVGLFGILTAALPAQTHAQPYSLASVEGEFALVGSYTGGIARQLGIVHVYGNGDADGFLRVNVPGATPTQRVVVKVAFTGTMAINDDGSGVVTLNVTYPDGSLHVATVDFLVTKADSKKNVPRAVEIEYMQRETPDLMPGALIVGTLLRRDE